MVDDSEQSDEGEDVACAKVKKAADSSSEEDEEFQAESDSESQEDQSSEEEEAKSSVKEAPKASKKRTKDGKPKKDAAAAAKGAKGAKDAKGGKPKEAKAMLNEKDSKLAIKEYMIKQNRPYSVQNLLDNMHGRVPKKICEKVLADLTDKEKVLVCKEFGKAKIYLANQDNFPATSTEELRKIDDQIKERKENLAT